MNRISCEKCGKFIADKDIDSCQQREIWSWDKIELVDVVYTCPKCLKKLNQKKESE